MEWPSVQHVMHAAKDTITSHRSTTSSTHLIHLGFVVAVPLSFDSWGAGGMTTLESGGASSSSFSRMVRKACSASATKKPVKASWASISCSEVGRIRSALSPPFP